MLNWWILSSSLFDRPFLIADMALQTTYLQQQTLLFIVAILVIPLVTAIRIFQEQTNNRLRFVHLTPLSHHEVVLGLIARDNIFLLFGIILHLPLTLICLFSGNVTFMHVIMTTYDLLMTAILFSSMSFMANLFLYYTDKKTMTLFGGIIVCVLLLYFMGFNELGIIKTNTLISPFRFMSRQGLQTTPLRLQSSLLALETSLSSMKEARKKQTDSIDRKLISLLKKIYENHYILKETQANSKLSILLFNKAFSKQTPLALELQDSVRNLQQTLIDFRESLSYRYAYLDEKHTQNQAYYNESRITPILMQETTLVELDRWLEYRREHLQSSIKKLKNLTADSHALRKEVLGILEDRKSLKYYTDDEIKLLLWLGHRDSEKRKRQIVLRLYSEIADLESQDLSAYINKIEEMETTLLTNDQSISPDTLRVLFHHIPFLIRFAETSTWLPETKTDRTSKSLLNVEKAYKLVMEHVLKANLPVSLINTNIINASFRHFDKKTSLGIIKREIWLSLFGTYMMRLVLIVTIYMFLLKNIFRNPPIYLSTPLNIVFSLIFAVIGVQLLSFDVYQFFSTSLGLSPSHPSAFIGIIFLMFLALLYNMIPFSKARFFTRFEKIMAFFNPLFSISIAALVFLLFYYSFDLEDKEIFLIFPVMLVLYEMTRQLFSFKLSKAKAGIAAYFFMGFMPIILIWVIVKTVYKKLRSLRKAD